MLKIPDHATIIAPVNLHLPLYETILKQKQNCLGIEVISLSAFIHRYLPIAQNSELVILYKYKEALQNLSKSNPFYESRNEPEFLSECLRFIKEIKLYGIHDFPFETAKEKALHEIIDILLPIQLEEDCAKNIQWNHLDHVYILQKEYPVASYYWINQLISHGAKWLKNDTVCEKNYYSTSNGRKQAQLVAETIIKNAYDASQVFIAVNESKDTWVIQQMLDAYKIPYTNLSNRDPSPIVDQWVAGLHWIQQKNKSHFKNVIETIYPEVRFINDFLELFPDGKILDHQYEKNAFIDEYTWNRYMKWEEKYQDWEKNHDLNWSIEDLAKIIQEKNVPTLTNLSLFNSIQQLIADSISCIHQADDYTLLIHAIENLSMTSNAETIKGVLIGSRKDISPLRPITFFINVYGKVFPALSQESGIFNEEYREKTNLPDLEYRLDQQRSILYDTLNACETLFVLLPEADYHANNNEASVEMNEWMGKSPTFINVKDSSIWIRPRFSLTEKNTQDLFFKNKEFHGSVSRLESFASCPLKHFLQYGLHLHEQKSWTDIRTRGTLLHSILEQITHDFGKEYSHCSKQTIEKYIQHAFQWIEKEFPHRQDWFRKQKEELLTKLSLLFVQLDSFESQWHMQTTHQEKKLELHYNWQDIDVTLIGYIDRIDESKTSFCIFDYKNGKRTLSLNKFVTGISLQLPVYALAYEKESQRLPLGSFYITLNPSPQKAEAFKIKYNRKKDNIKAVNEKTYQQQFDKDLKPNGWNFQDLSIYSDKKALKSQTLKFQMIETALPDIINSLLTDIYRGQIAPVHDKDACTWCHYQSICRNAKKEVIKEARTEVEE